MSNQFFICSKWVASSSFSQLLDLMMDWPFPHSFPCQASLILPRIGAKLIFALILSLSIFKNANYAMGFPLLWACTSKGHGEVQTRAILCEHNNWMTPLQFLALVVQCWYSYLVTILHHLICLVSLLFQEQIFEIVYVESSRDLPGWCKLRRNINCTPLC